MSREEDQGMRPPPFVRRGTFDVSEHPQGVLEGQKQRLSQTLTCDQASLYFRGGKEHLIQLLDYLSVASPESGLFSDW